MPCVLHSLNAKLGSPTFKAWQKILILKCPSNKYTIFLATAIPLSENFWRCMREAGGGGVDTENCHPRRLTNQKRAQANLTLFLTECSV